MAMNLQNILATFDNPEKKGFDYSDVISEIGKQLPDEEKELQEVRLLCNFSGSIISQRG